MANLEYPLGDPKTPYPKLGYLRWFIYYLGMPGVSKQWVHLRDSKVSRGHTTFHLVFIRSLKGNQIPSEIRAELGSNHAYGNISNKIWLFWEPSLRVQILEDNVQQVTCYIYIFSHCTESVYLTSVLITWCNKLNIYQWLEEFNLTKVTYLARTGSEPNWKQKKDSSSEMAETPFSICET